MQRRRRSGIGGGVGRGDQRARLKHSRVSSGDGRRPHPSGRAHTAASGTALRGVDTGTKSRHNTRKLLARAGGPKLVPQSRGAITRLRPDRSWLLDWRHGSGAFGRADGRAMSERDIAPTVDSRPVGCGRGPANRTRIRALAPLPPARPCCARPTDGGAARGGQVSVR